MTPKGMVFYGKWIGVIIMLMAFPMRDIFGQFAGDLTITIGFGLAIILLTVDLVVDIDEVSL